MLKVRAFSFSRLLRLFLIISMLTGALLTSWVGLSTRAYATAAPQPATPSSSSPSAKQMRQGVISKLQQQPGGHVTPNIRTSGVNATTPYNGLGDLSFYTYVANKKLTDQLTMKVNVANGNLLLNQTEMQIHGTGLDLNVSRYYNSRFNSLSLDTAGYYWNWSTGRGILADTQNPSNGVTIFGPSGEEVFFAPDGNGGFKDAPGMNASFALAPAVYGKPAYGGNYYCLTFHKSGECWLFDSLYGSFIADIDKNGNAIYFYYDHLGNLLYLTDTQGRQINFTHDSNSQVTKIADPSGRSTSMTYTSTSDFLTTTNAENKTTTYGYTNDTSGDFINKITDPNNKSTTFTYTTGGKIATITDARAKTIIFTYYTSSDSACSNIVPAPNPALPCTVVTDQSGHSTTYSYNPQYQVTYTKDAFGHVSSKTFDATNYNVTQYGDALGDFSNFTFSQDGRNNLTASIDGNGAKTQFGYPAAGGNNPYYPLNQSDPQGHQTDYTYDTNGNALSATDDSSGKGLTYTYNGNGTVASQKDADGNTTTYGYDSKGNLTSINQPAPLGQTTLTVDALSRVTSMTDGNHHKTSYSYDNVDRVTKITYADTSTVTYSYDGNGNVLSETDNTGTTSFQYDELNRIHMKTLPGGTVITSSYDSVGNLTGYDDGTGKVSYTYDRVNRVTVVTEPDSSQTQYGYDNANRKTSIRYPNGTGMLMTYDASGHETSNASGVFNTQNTNQFSTSYSNYQYNYQSGANNTALLQSTTYLDPVSHSSTFVTSYSYDTLNRLIEAATTLQGQNNKVEDFAYSYDPNSNMLTKKVLSTGLNENYTYNTANELTTRSSGSSSTTYSYDGIGNLTGSTNGPTVAYNAKNQSTSIGSNNYTYSGTTQSERVQVNGDSYVYGGLGLTRVNTSAGTTEYTRCSCGMLNNERTPDGKKYYYLLDGLGSVIGMTDSSGAEVNRYQYDPYGATYNKQEQTGINNPWKFASGYLDSSTGLYKYGIRYYDPTTGRWTQRTPVGGSLQETLKANPYTYADNNPVNEVDSSGKDPLTCGLTLGLAAATAIIGLGLLVSAIATAPVGAAAVGTGVILSGTEAAIVGAGLLSATGVIGGIIAYTSNVCP